MERSTMGKMLFSAGILILIPAVGQAGMKGRIQQKLESPSNVQYEPYNLMDTNNRRNDNALPQAPVPGVRPIIRQQAGERQAANSPESVPQEALVPSATSRPPALSSSAIYNVSYKAEMEDNVVTVNGTVTFEVFKKGGWTQLPLVSSQVGLIDVRVNKGKSFVVNQGDRYYLMIDRPGRYQLELEFLIKVAREREAGPGSFSLDVMPAPISQFEFTMPEKDVQVFVEPSIKVELTHEENKTTAWAVMPNTSTLNVRWTKALPKEEIVSARLEPKVFAETHTQAMVGGGVISCRSQLNYSILQAEVSSLRILLPEKTSVLRVSGANLRDWKVTPQDGGQYLDVFFNFGVKGNYNLTLEYERGINEGSQVVEMPWVKPLGVERGNGFYGIGASTNVELAVKALDKVTEIDIRQLPDVIWAGSDNPILLAFKYLNHPINIAIEMTRHEELPVLIASVDSAEYTTLYTKEGKALTKAVYRVRNNVKQFLRFRLPAGAVVWSAFVAGKPVKPASGEKGSVLVPLEKSPMQNNTLMQFPVEIVYLEKGAKLGFSGRVKMTLPELDVPTNEFFWSLYVPQDYTYFLFDGDMNRLATGEGGGILAGMIYAQRSVRGRMRQAADDIGDPFSAAAQAVFEQKEAGVAKGLLPIRIDVPRQGKLLQFQKMLIVEGESPHLKFRYAPFPGGLKGIIKFAVWAGLVVLLVRWLRRLRIRKKPVA